MKANEKRLGDSFNKLIICRNLKRVPLNFSWKLNEIWKGYIQRNSKECYNPPIGRGFQIWESVSEGSPITPPLPTLEEAISFLIKTDNSITKNLTKEDWEFILNNGKGAYINTKTGEFEMTANQNQDFQVI